MQTQSRADWFVARCIPVAVAALALVLGFRFWQYLRFAIDAVTYPFGMDYGEGIVWQQALLIPGPRMYGDIDQYPYIVFHYPPFYHLLVRAVAAFGVDYLAAGRGISTAASVVAAGLLAALAFRALRAHSRGAACVGALVAGLVIFTCRPIAAWAPLMRVDMLATALGILGIWCSVLAVERPRLAYLAIGVFVLAGFTKQTSLAAPLASACLLLLARPRTAVKAMGVGAVLGGVLLGGLVVMTHGGFLRHIISYNVNRYSLVNAILRGVHWQWPYAVYLGLAIASLGFGWQLVLYAADAGRIASLRRQVLTSRYACVLLVFSVYFVISAVMLLMLGKSGAADNYLIEWMCTWSVPIGMLAGAAVGSGRFAWVGTGHMRPAAALLVVLLLIAQVLVLPFHNRFPDEAERRELAELLEKIRLAPRPVVSDDMVMLLRAGKEVPIEPAIFAELASRGVWDERPFLEMIRTHAFSFITTDGRGGHAIYEARHTPAVRDAIEAAYPRIVEMGGRTLHLHETGGAGR